MMEKPYILRLNIDHYEAMLKLDMDEEKRSTVQRLIGEAKEKLQRMTNSEDRSDEAAIIAPPD